MELSEVYTILNSVTGFTGKVVYRAWEEGQVPDMPFAVYYFRDNGTFYADGKVYYAAKNITVDLYTKDKAPETEALIEAALTNAGLGFLKSEDFLPEEKCFCITYELGV